MSSVLYQANQKAYEATLLKKFVAHALHPDRVAKCFEDSEGRLVVVPYLQSVVQNVKGMADKMIWNAHCRVVNLLAQDGRDGAPFLDVNRLSQCIFSDFGPNNTISVVDRLKESWHRAISELSMVQMSTKQYPIRSNSFLFEEIDEMADKIFNETSFANTLPTGRTTKSLYRRKGKGQGAPGALLREESQNLSRGNWLTFPAFHLPEKPATLSSTSRYQQDTSLDADAEIVSEQYILGSLCDLQQPNSYHDQEAQSVSNHAYHTEASSTRLEDLHNRYGAHAILSSRINTPIQSGGDELAVKIPSWRVRLIIDHKRRLTHRWGKPPQTLRRALPSIRKIVTDALTRGFRLTGTGFESRVRIIEVQEQRQTAISSPATSEPHRGCQPSNILLSLQSSSLQHTGNSTSTTKEQHVDHVGIPRKRQKTNAILSGEKVTRFRPTKQTRIGYSQKPDRPHILTEHGRLASSLLAHSIGSKMLEPHQNLPPNAYFGPKSSDEKPAWRCGIKHAMGYYYNAGNRTSCPGCFTNIKDNVKTRRMDFYLPLWTYSFQPAPDLFWTPSKPLDKARRSKTLSHNSIAKVAYWAAIDTGATAVEARQAGVDAVETALRLRAPKEPSPALTLSPEPDLGPHPSGSTTMEHSQALPDCAYFEPQEENERLAWRCDINHALGRYYLAGDKRSCPGCGSNIAGVGKRTGMDFYMPSGAVVRQKALEESHWTPRKPYRRNSKSIKTKYLTHNQSCSKKYFETIELGHTHDDAIRIAIEEVDVELDSRPVEKMSKSVSENTDARRQSARISSHSVLDSRSREKSHERCMVPLVPLKRGTDDPSDDEARSGSSESFEMETVDQDMIEYLSSSEEETSGSDSE
jgi:hypothetical protein